MTRVPSKPQSSITTVTMSDIAEPISQDSTTHSRTQHGMRFTPQQQIFLYSPDEWELFIQEWVYYCKREYHKVSRCSGANDMGIDIAGFESEAGFNGIWDNYQCKHYSTPLTPSIAILEAGKIIWHIFNKKITCPRKYYFVAPKDCGVTLSRLLNDIPSFKDKLFERWDDWCKSKITKTKRISIEGPFKNFLVNFNFGIFTYKPTIEVIDGHSTSPCHSTRFGGGLPSRTEIIPPPREVDTKESRYLEQLFLAYSDNKKEKIENLEKLEKWPKLLQHYHRQREDFYSAESLKNFARDNVPNGTFESLQDEVYNGVIDEAEKNHTCALTKVKSVVQTAAILPISSNGLLSVTKTQDKKGICHQLANTDRLIWKDNEK